MKRIEDIKRRGEAATPGPWRVSHSNVAGDHIWAHDDQWLAGVGEDDSNDAQFIAHAREDVPWLLQRLERAEALLGMIDRGHPDVEAYFAEEDDSNG